jgi:hypothetical protein
MQREFDRKPRSERLVWIEHKKTKSVAGESWESYIAASNTRSHVSASTTPSPRPYPDRTLTDLPNAAAHCSEIWTDRETAIHAHDYVRSSSGQTHRSAHSPARRGMAASLAMFSTSLKPNTISGSQRCDECVTFSNLVRRMRAHFGAPEALISPWAGTVALLQDRPCEPLLVGESVSELRERRIRVWSSAYGKFRREKGVVLTNPIGVANLGNGRDVRQDHQPPSNGMNLTFHQHHSQTCEPELYSDKPKAVANLTKHPTHREIRLKASRLRFGHIAYSIPPPAATMDLLSCFCPQRLQPS